MSEIRTESRFPVGNKHRKRAASTTIPRSIVIVDDNLDDARLAERLLQQLNTKFQVTILASGQELIAHLQEEPSSTFPAPPLPTAILLDLGMPDLDGFAVLDWCARQPKFANIPIIVLTNFTELPHMKRAYALGARSYLLKPMEESALRSVLSSLNISV